MRGLVTKEREKREQATYDEAVEEERIQEMYDREAYNVLRRTVGTRTATCWTR